MKKQVSELVTNLPERMVSDPKGALYDFARIYARIMGTDFDREILPNLGNYSYWEANYVDPTKEKWGMETSDAFRCLVDVQRTERIFAGNAEEVRHLEKHRGEKTSAIDAGIGTGILAISLISLGVGNVKGIEIVEETFNKTREFLEELGLSDRVHVIFGDATKVDPGVEADILISENLSSGLLDEPQYQIIEHLSSSLKPNGTIIPAIAQLFVSLGRGDWENAPLKKGKKAKSIASRRLPELRVLSDKYPFTTVVSRKGMTTPIINGGVQAVVADEEAANTLLISTRFRINAHGDPKYLEPDTAEFLGKTLAIKLPEEVEAARGRINVELLYPAGADRNRAIIETYKGNVRFAIT